MTQLINTALKPTHIKLNAKIIKFSNYEMPVWYSDINTEHQAVRHHAGIFDVSHMGLIEIKGETRFDFINGLICSNLTKCTPQKLLYSMVLNESGGILDDIMIVNLTDSFLLIVNCSNKSKILNWIEGHKPNSVTITDLNPSYSLIALQGPYAQELLHHLNIDCQDIKRMESKFCKINNQLALVMRSGYTGENGYEIMIQNQQANEFWQECIQNGAQPCGLGSRDTLRLEAGLPLYGQELTDSLTPLSTRYAKWVVDLTKDFIGKAALEKVKDTAYPVTIGLKISDPKMIPRYGYTIKEGGYITSGTLSPTLKLPIAMAIVDPQTAALNKVHVIIRNKEVEAEVTPLPFI